MTVKIYCINDCNGINYVGSTKEELNVRLNHHRSDKKKEYRHCSSEKLDLYNCEIKLLEQCEDCDRKDRERFYIEIIDCVNVRKLNIIQDNQYYRNYLKKWRSYKNTWGGDARSNNNLLKIDLNIFNYDNFIT
tara:strand:- start:258 stop:656 length:399 start_codon:yes stop_codon:yes gene_type:complete